VTIINGTLMGDPCEAPFISLQDILVQLDALIKRGDCGLVDAPDVLTAQAWKGIVQVLILEGPDYPQFKKEPFINRVTDVFKSIQTPELQRIASQLQVYLYRHGLVYGQMPRAMRT
jgi:hypothetical protein